MMVVLTMMTMGTMRPLLSGHVLQHTATPAPAACCPRVCRRTHRNARDICRPPLPQMNPRSPSFDRVMRNPIAYTAFKSTEPWLQVRLPPRSPLVLQYR